MRGTNWQALPLGGVIVHPGNSVEYATGSWRAFRPIVHWDPSPGQKACTKCLICWVYCPESAMAVEGGMFVGVDLDHCKGCGICADVCPSKCIKMIEESEFNAKAELPERQVGP